MRLLRVGIIFWFATVLLVLPIWVEAAGLILIEGAMECETSLLIKGLDNPSEERIGGWRFVSGEYQGIPVVVSVTSIGTKSLLLHPMPPAMPCQIRGVYQYSDELPEP